MPNITTASIREITVNIIIVGLEQNVRTFSLNGTILFAPNNLKNPLCLVDNTVNDMIPAIEIAIITITLIMLISASDSVVLEYNNVNVTDNPLFKKCIMIAGISELVFTVMKAKTRPTTSANGI